MGPGLDSYKPRGVDPPFLKPDRDTYVWKKKVSQWVDLIPSAAEMEEDKFYQTIFVTMARKLYKNGLPPDQKSIVYEAQQKGLIDYKQPDHVKAVKQIVNLICIDTPVRIVTRLIESFNRVSNWRKKKEEDLSASVSCFRGLAGEHLIHAGVTSSSQVG